MPGTVAPIGSLYNKRNVVVGQAAGFIAPAYSVPPPDSATVFDPAVYLNYAVSVGAATAGSITVTLTGGPFLLTGPVTTGAIAWNASASVAAAAIQAVLPAGYTAVVTGTGATAWQIYIVGPGSYDIVVTAVIGTALTGGALLVVPPIYTAAGATEQGWQVNYNPSTQDITIEEQQTPVGQEINSAVYQFQATLSEDTAKQLAWALGATTTVQAADSTHFGKTTLNLQGDLPTYTVVLETKNRKSFPRRYYVPEMTCAANFTQTFRRSNGQRMVPVTFSSICAIEDISVEEIEAIPTS